MLCIWLKFALEAVLTVWKRPNSTFFWFYQRAKRLLKFKFIYSRIIYFWFDNKNDETLDLMHEGKLRYFMTLNNKKLIFLSSFKKARIWPISKEGHIFLGPPWPTMDPPRRISCPPLHSLFISEYNLTCTFCLKTLILSQRNPRNFSILNS